MARSASASTRSRSAPAGTDPPEASGDPRSRADDQRERVLRAAAEIFSRRGYRGTTMTDIAVEVGLRKPSLYHYFRNKEELLVRLYEDVLDESLVAARNIVASSPTPHEALRALIAQRVSYTCHHRDLLTVFFEEEAELPPSLAGTLLTRRREFEDIVMSVVEAGLAASPDGSTFATPVRVYANACLGAANWVYKWYNPRGPLSPEELGEHIADVMLRALPAP